MNKISYHNHNISYQITGSGLPLVFLHGFGENSKMWEDYTPQFSGYRVITIDLPGAGSSDFFNASIARMAKIVNAVLLEERIEKCVMIGHSMGGYVTLAFAKLYEQKLLGYCLFHSQPNADSEEKKAGRDKAISFVKTHGAGPYLKGLIPKLFSTQFKEHNPQIINKMIDWVKDMSPNAVIGQLVAMRDRPDNQNVLRNAKVPVCFIIGEEDVAVPTENSLNQTHLPSIADINILPDVGHQGMFEARDETVVILRKFIAFCQALP